MSESRKRGKFSYCLYKAIRWVVKLVYPEIKTEGEENLPDSPFIAVGNHSQMNGPIASEFYFPGKRAIWCAGQMMHLKMVPAYAYKDFWSGKPKYIKWFFKLLSYIIAPFSVCVFNNAHTIPVYRDSHIVTTFRRTVEAMKDGTNIIIFPECAEKNNCIVNKFQENFIDVAKLYYKRTQKAVSFVPMYLAPKLKKMYFGKPTVFNPNAPIDEERRRICNYLSEQITNIGMSLPRHIVVPYNNVPRRLYTTNIPCEVEKENEKTNG